MLTGHEGRKHLLSHLHSSSSPHPRLHVCSGAYMGSCSHTHPFPVPCRTRGAWESCPTARPSLGRSKQHLEALMSAHSQQPKPGSARISPFRLGEHCQLSTEPVVSILQHSPGQLGCSFLSPPQAQPPGYPRLQKWGPACSSFRCGDVVAAEVLTRPKVTPQEAWFPGAPGLPLNISHFSPVTSATFPPPVSPSGRLAGLCHGRGLGGLQGKERRDV